MCYYDQGLSYFTTMCTMSMTRITDVWFLSQAEEALAGLRSELQDSLEEKAASCKKLETLIFARLGSTLGLQSVV